jgi:RNA polymerase sigma-70 factor, ECF subfamily
MTPEHEAGRLYDAYGASLYRYALMILASREGAEDVIQQVFAALLDSRRRRIDDEERYLRRAVRNACYSALRHQKIRRGPAVDEALLEVAAEAAPVSEEDRIALAEAIRELPPDQREVIHLHIFEGRTFKDVAEMTGEPLNTIASRYRYALEKLKATLTPSE